MTEREKITSPVNDPWEDVRERVDEEGWVLNGSALPLMDPHVAILRLLADADALLAMRDTLIDISEQEEENCGYCNGSGGRYADGGAHYPSENAPMVPCGQCGGYGKVPPADAREIATAALAALPDYLRGGVDERAEIE